MTPLAGDRFENLSDRNAFGMQKPESLIQSQLLFIFPQANHIFVKSIQGIVYPNEEQIISQILAESGLNLEIFGGFLLRILAGPEKIQDTRDYKFSLIELLVNGIHID